MAIVSFKNVKITAMTTVVPEKEINIYDEAHYYDNSIKKIDRMRKMVGFYKRRVADESTTAVDLGYVAAKKLIEKLGIDKNTIDALIFVVQQPDYVSPVNAYFIHDKLGLSKDCIATDVTQGCAGWVFGLYIASQMISSGVHKRILLVNADTPTKDVDITDRNQAPIFGDAGSATLVEYSVDEIYSSYNIETKSDSYDAIIPPFFGRRFYIDYANDDDFKLLEKLRTEKVMLPTGNVQPLLSSHIDGLRVFDFCINFVPETIKKLLSASELAPNDVSILALHQANKQIVQAVGSGAGFDLDKVPYSAFENYGNNTMCSIPTTLALLDKNLMDKRVCCCGFGNGLVSAACILNLKDTFISDIESFEQPDYVMSKDEYVDYWRNKMKGTI